MDHDDLVEDIAGFPDDLIRGGYRMIALAEMADLIWKCAKYLGHGDTRQLLQAALEWVDLSDVKDQMELDRTEWEAEIEIARLTGKGQL